MLFRSTKLNRGDVILACTDGLVQSHSLRGEQFGKERIQQCILDNSTYPAQRMTQFTFDSLIKFMSKEMEDDVSILVLKYETSREFNDEDEEEEAGVEEAAGEEKAEEAPAEEAVADNEAPAAPEDETAVPEPVEGPQNEAPEIGRAHV